MHWKDKLEGLGSLSQENWDKNASWDKLGGRLNQRPAGRKILYGLIAVAACLGLILGIIWINGSKKDIATDSSIIFKPVDAKKPLLIENPIQEELAGSKHKKLSSNNHVASYTSAEKEKAVSPVVTEPSEEQNKELNTETNSTPISPLPDSAVAVSNPPRKLPVVHINELGKTKTQNAKVASATQNITDGSYREGTTDFFSRNSDDNIFKIKLFSHN